MIKRLRYSYLAYLSKPSEDRVLYRSIRKGRFRKILEIGIGTTQRAGRMIETAALGHPVGSICYTGIDLFEMRKVAQSCGVSLKLAHRQLSATKARVRLVPGDPLAALSQAANSLVGQDLVVISADLEQASLARAWFYVPRLLHEGTRVYLQEPGDGESLAASPQAGCGGRFRLLDPSEVQRLAAAAKGRRAA